MPVELMGKAEKLEAAKMEIYGHWSINLGDFFMQTKYGYKVGSFVYTVFDEENCIYVGQTSRSVFARLIEHSRMNTPLGQWLQSVVLPTNNTLSIISCGLLCLDDIEKTLIARWKPSLNIVQYHSDETALLLPEQIKIQVDINRTFIHGMKLPVSLPSRASIDGVMKAASMDDLVGSLYDRAYRDPNNPKLKIRAEPEKPPLDE